MDENQRINEEYRIAYKLKCCSMSLISLAILHLVLFDFFWILTDLCSALIVYFTYNNRTNLIAIFSLVNGIIGLIYSVIKGMYHISYLKETLNSNITTIYLFFLFAFSVIIYTFVIIYSYFGYKYFRPAFAPDYQLIPLNPTQILNPLHPQHRGLIVDSGRPEFLVINM